MPCAQQAVDGISPEPREVRAAESRAHRTPEEAGDFWHMWTRSSISPLDTAHADIAAVA